jgi:deoxyribodipyrimidine photolyase-like uncharacterized protein
MYKLVLHKELAARWQNFSVSQRLLMIANELQRAGNWIHKKDWEEAAQAYERAFELVDLTVESANNNNFIKEILRWRELLAMLYSSKGYEATTNNKLLSALITLDPGAYKIFYG